VLAAKDGGLKKVLVLKEHVLKALALKKVLAALMALTLKV
jgi:hypothetical protein